MDVVLPKAGKYVVAVSGGVDSMVLLDILAKQPDLKLTVAHLDHGIRPDSAEDAEVVSSVSATLGVAWVGHQAKLGKKTSEAKAREIRYKYLRKVAKDTNSEAIITAHHQDDVIETAILNMLRGTGRKGLTSLGEHDGILRPLLKVPKVELITYAKAHKLKWREDSTNSDTKYLRNYIRHNYVTKLDQRDRQELLDIISSLRSTNDEMDTLLVKYLNDQTNPDSVDRDWFNHLPHNVSREVLAAWLRSNDVRTFDSKTLERLVVAAKTGQTGKTFPVVSGYNMRVNKDHLALSVPER